MILSEPTGVSVATPEGFDTRTDWPVIVDGRIMRLRLRVARGSLEDIGVNARVRHRLALTHRDGCLHDCPACAIEHIYSTGVK